MKKEISFETLQRWLKDSDCDVRAAAMEACQGREVPLDVIQQGLKDSKWRVRAAAMKACEGREVPLDVIQQGLKDLDCRVRAAAMEACQGREVPLEVIQRWLKDSDCDVRAAAMEACQGREVPLEVIQQGLKDSDWHVRAAAMEACQGRSIEFPVIRTIEPPETVYKKCKFGVLICAAIPSDAQVRGSYGQKCRASKAVITDVIGNVCGEPVGISGYDGRTTYYAGNEVEIEDFDFSDKECAAGFHFFCTREEAERYNF